MIAVTETLVIPADELEWSYARSGGPGGQNVNKVASKTVLRWAMEASPSVLPGVKDRIRTARPSQVTTDGDLLIVSQRFRDQERNRQDCVEKLVGMGAGRVNAAEAAAADKTDQRLGAAAAGRQKNERRPEGRAARERQRLTSRSGSVVHLEVEHPGHFPEDQAAWLARLVVSPHALE